MAAGVAAVGGLAYAAKKSIDFQDAFAGVRKTVEGSDADLGALETQLRALATRIPVQFTDLAGIAQEAGALGVAAPKVANFTEVVARLSAATVGLTPEAAAEAFGKLGNVLQFNAKNADPKAYERLGSALVELGNNAASSEGDIIEVAKRFGAAGHQAGLSAPQILGFASAIASLGVEPEAAGSALSRVFNRITSNIATGNDKFKVLAKVSGETAAQFKKNWGTDAAGAFELFLSKLKNMDKFAAAKALHDAGITNVRDVNMILLLAQNYGELQRQVGLSNNAFAANNALQDVSTKRFDTLQGHITTLTNSLMDSAAAMADGFTPAIGRVVEKARTMLTDHRADFVKAGQEIGKAIDSIDWAKVRDAAESVAGVARTLLDLISKIPPQISLAVAGFMALNKVTGGAPSQIAGGALSVVSGLGSLLLRGAGKKIGGLAGGALGMLGGGSPVFVTNWPPGFGLGGALPGIGAAAGEGGLMAAAMAALPWAVIGASIAGPIIAGIKISSNNSNIANGITTAVNDQINSPASLADLQKSLSGVDEGLNNLNNMWGAQLVAGDSINQLQSQHDALVKAINDYYIAHPNIGFGNANSREDRNADTRPSNANEREDRGQMTDLAGKLADDQVNLVQMQRAVWAEFKNDIHSLTKAQKPADVQKATAALIERIVGKHQGNADSTALALGALRKQLAHTHDPETASILRAAITKVEHKVADRSWVEGQLVAARKIERSTGDSKSKIDQLTKVQQTLLARGDIHAAATVTKAIDAEKAKVAAAAKAAGQQAAFAIRDKDMTYQVTTNTAISVLASIGLRSQTSTMAVSQRLGRTFRD